MSVVHRTTAADCDKALEVYAIYERPADYPRNYVVRRWRIVSGVQEPIPDLDPIAVTGTIEAARESLPRGLTWLQRSEIDDPAIVETWI